MTMSQSNNNYSAIATEGSVYESGYTTTDDATKTAAHNDNNSLRQCRVEQHLHAEAPWSAYTSSYGQAIESKAQNAIATQIHTFDRTFNNTYNNKCLGNSDVSNNNAVQYEGGRYASQYDPWLVYAQTYGQAEAQRAMAAQASSFERNLSASPTASNNNTNAKKQLSTDAPEVEK